MQTAPEQDGAPVEAEPTPLFRFDPGWPFVIAGLLLLVTAVLIPAQRDLHELRNALELQRAAEDQALRQLAAYDRFLNDLDQAEPQLVSRLAASQLNLMPKDERSMLLVPTLNSTVTDWIEDSEPLLAPAVAPYPDTLLSRLATGPRRLWVLACGAFLVFVGLMLSPASGRAPKRSSDVPVDRSAPRIGGAVAPVASAVAASAPISISASAAASELDDHDPAGGGTALLTSAEESHDSCDSYVSHDLPQALRRFEVVEVEAVEVEAVEVEAVEVEAVEVEGAEIDETPSAETAPVALTEIENSNSVEASGDASVHQVAEAACSLDAHAIIFESKPIQAVRESDFIDESMASPEDSSPSVDGGEAIDFETRANTEAVAGDDAEREDSAIDGEHALPLATDRALDSMSLFHGLSDDRWIETRDRG